MAKIKVALLSAGLAPQNFEMALKRILDSSTKIYSFSNVFALDTSNITKYCPKVSFLYGEYLNARVPGFGYWLWKPEFIYTIARGDFGEFDQIVWVDSGCEINANLVSRIKFKSRILEAQEVGIWVHALKNSEHEYSKNSVISQFPELGNSALEAPQIQANYMHFSTRKAFPLIREWFDKSLGSVSNFDLSSIQIEDPKFIEHKSDQSVLSLIVKKYGYKHSRLNLPNGRTWKSALRGISEPVWISRNRRGESLIPSWIRRLP